MTKTFGLAYNCIIFYCPFTYEILSLLYIIVLVFKNKTMDDKNLLSKDKALVALAFLEKEGLQNIIIYII